MFVNARIHFAYTDSINEIGERTLIIPFSTNDVALPLFSNVVTRILNILDEAIFQISHWGLGDPADKVSYAGVMQVEISQVFDTIAKLTAALGTPVGLEKLEPGILPTGDLDELFVKGPIRRVQKYVNDENKICYISTCEPLHAGENLNDEQACWKLFTFLNDVLINPDLDVEKIYTNQDYDEFIIAMRESYINRKR